MITIRPAKIEDAARLIEIYAPYVKETAITFEYDVPSLEDFQARIRKTKEKYPYLVVEVDHQVEGYAYASTYYGRRAYDWTAELSIYLDQSVHAKGLGKRLYDQLEEELEQAGIKNFLACIAVPNEKSVRFHEKRGYEQVAHFKEVGFKFDQWHDTVWLEKRLKK